MHILYSYVTIIIGRKSVLYLLIFMERHFSSQRFIFYCKSKILQLIYLQVFSTLILSICPIRWSWLPAFAVIGLYQYALSHMSLSDYILHGSDRSDSRESIIDANREGICSCLGYIALFLVGAQIGFFIFCKK